MRKYEMPTVMQEQKYISKWLWWLLCIQIASMSVGVLANTLSIGYINDFMKIVCAAGVLFCLLRLRREHIFYALASAFLGVQLVCRLFQILISSESGYMWLLPFFEENANWWIIEVNRVLLVVLPIAGLLASVIEYLAHSKLTKQCNPGLSKWWIWLTVSTLVLFTVMRVVTANVTDMFERGTLDIALYQRVYPWLNLPAMLLKIVYMAFLFRTGRIVTDENSIETELQHQSLTNNKYRSLALYGIGIAFWCLAIVLAVLAANESRIPSGVDSSRFMDILLHWNKGLYFMLITLGNSVILVSILINAKSARLKNAVFLVLPMLLFQILRVPYQWVNRNYLVHWLGCGCIGFGANDLTRIFWRVIAVATAVISWFTSGKALKNKIWLRILYVVSVLLISLLVARRYYNLMCWT